MAPNQTCDIREKYAAELSDHSNHSPMTQLLYVLLYYLLYVMVQHIFARIK